MSKPEAVKQEKEEEEAKQELVKMVGRDNKEYLNVMAELICSEDLLKASVASPPSTDASANQTKYKVIREFG